MRKLYHYTSIEHLQEILSDGVIKRTCSNLAFPTNCRIEEGCVVSDTDHIKPVVWFTDKQLDVTDNGKGLGIYGGIMDKTACAIVLQNPTPNKYIKWSDWAIKNHIDPEWFDALKSSAPYWDSFYICEKPVKIDHNVKIIIRSDILEELKGA